MAASDLLKKAAYPAENDKKRTLYLFDNLRFFLIFCVVIGHFYDDFTILSGSADNVRVNDLLKEMFVFIYSFHMPLFIFISGLFDKKRDKLDTNCIIYFISLGFLLKLLLAITRMTLEITKPKAYFKLFEGDGVFWFIFALAVFKFLCFALRNADRRFVLFLSVSLALFSGYDNDVNDFLNISRIIVFFPFYYLGFILSPQKIRDLTRRIPVKIISVCIIGVWFWQCFFNFEEVEYLRRLFTGKNPYSKILIEDCQYYHRAFAMLISIGMCLALISLMPDIILPFATKFGSRTLQVYFWHRPVIYLLTYFGVSENIIRIYPNSWWIAFAAVAFAITFVLSIKIFGAPLKAVRRAVCEQAQ